MPDKPKLQPRPPSLRLLSEKCPKLVADMFQQKDGALAILRAS